MMVHRFQFFTAGWRRGIGSFFATLAFSSSAAQLDLVGPPGSVAFGTQVAVLPNGNIVVTDPSASAIAPNAGAVYLYTADGTLISALTGSNANDRVGAVTVLSNGNFVVASAWSSGSAANVGAITWVDGDTGLSGAVSATNSLVGSTAGDAIGSGGMGAGVTALTNGNYVVVSSSWDNGAVPDVGAVTWVDGSKAVSGQVTAANSLVGSTPSDLSFHRVTAIGAGNYLVQTQRWDHGPVVDAGAITWGNGATGTVGEISASISLVGSTAGDEIGSHPPILVANGNYVVQNSYWHGPGGTRGALTWGSATTATSGVVSAANSLVSSDPSAPIDWLTTWVTVLTNGNYVLATPDWSNGSVAQAGAATWGSGTIGISGEISLANSLIGTTAGDRVGGRALTLALTNGNYVVGSPFWDNGGDVDVGAATWANGSTGLVGTVSPANSVIGATPDERLGGSGAALSDGNFVIGSPGWDDGSTVDVGAVSWVDGSGPSTGTLTPANSLIGTTANDAIGIEIIAVADGNYVVESQYWDSPTTVDAGAVTWRTGGSASPGTVSAGNSLFGSKSGDLANARLWTLVGGNFVVTSPSWDNGAAIDVGAITWGGGTTGITGPISRDNSLIGSVGGDAVGNRFLRTFSDEAWVIDSSLWDNGAIVNAGAVTLGRGDTGGSGILTDANSVRGTVANQGSNLPFAYDSVRHRLVVGRPASNVVTLLSLPQPDPIFDDGFE